MIEAGLSRERGARRFYMVDQDGLLVEGMNAIARFQRRFAQPSSAACDMDAASSRAAIGLLDVVRNAKPTVLIGVSGQPGAFSEPVVRAMAEHNARPVIFPLSNPTSRAEATPRTSMTWSEGRAIIGTGSPFPPLDARRPAGSSVDQTNNSYIFPGRRARRDRGAGAPHHRRDVHGGGEGAGRHVARAHDPRGNPAAAGPALRSVAVTIAGAAAKQARSEGLCNPFKDEALPGLIAAKMWEPVYRPYRRKVL